MTGEPPSTGEGGARKKAGDYGTPGKGETKKKNVSTDSKRNRRGGGGKNPSLVAFYALRPKERESSRNRPRRGSAGKAERGKTRRNSGGEEEKGDALFIGRLPGRELI